MKTSQSEETERLSIRSVEVYWGSVRQSQDPLGSLPILQVLSNEENNPETASKQANQEKRAKERAGIATSGSKW